MHNAVKNVAKWLKEHSKRNPIPYKLFKTIVDRQITWARNKGLTLNFDELSEAVKTELLKSNFYVKSEDGSSNMPQGSTHSLFEEHSDFLQLNLSCSDNMPMLFGWLHSILNRAIA